jgi:two-component system cell cycle response regulator CpdR
MSPLILVADDETAIAEIVKDALEDGGFDVRVCLSGDVAMEAIEELGDGLAGIVTDIRIGFGPDGWAIARRARELHAGLAVIYMSGDSAADHTSQGVPDSVMIQKPFALVQIVTAIASLLNGAPVSY